MRAISGLLPSLPGLAGWTKTYAPSPVWRESTTAAVRFVPLRRKQATRLYHQARAFERQTRAPGRQDGALGRNGLAVLHALTFDFLNYASGQLDPSYEAIARMACISVRSVARGLQALKAAGVLDWVRRCAESFRDGRFVLEQESNAYAILPASQWHGFTPPPEVPVPEPGTWGDHPCGARDALTEALAEIAQAREEAEPAPDLTQGQGGSGSRAGDAGRLASVVRQLEADPGNALASVLARLGRALGKTGAAENPSVSRRASLSKNPSGESLP